MKSLMRTRTIAILPVTLAIALFPWAGSVPAQELEVSRSHVAASEPYGAPVTPVYLINFLFLYMANPHVAANMPAYRASAHGN
jgi:hypothetical protein